MSLGREGGNMVREVKTKVLLGNSHFIIIININRFTKGLLYETVNKKTGVLVLTFPGKLSTFSEPRFLHL